MIVEGEVSNSAIEAYLRARPRRVRWREWASARRYRVGRFEDRPMPVVVLAHSFRDRGMAEQFGLMIQKDWTQVPSRCREAYDEILDKAPGIVVVQLKRTNVCGCLGHRHVAVKETPFSDPHEAFGGASCGEIDIAFERVKSWKALPLTDTALDTKFLSGSRLEEFHAEQFRMRLLSVLLHEINHLVYPNEPEASVRERSLAFYREALAGYVEAAVSTLSLTYDRSFSRFD
jgi:hypothetical protein